MKIGRRLNYVRQQIWTSQENHMAQRGSCSNYIPRSKMPSANKDDVSDAQTRWPRNHVQTRGCSDSLLYRSGTRTWRPTNETAPCVPSNRSAAARFLGTCRIVKFAASPFERFQKTLSCEGMRGWNTGTWGWDLFDASSPAKGHTGSRPKDVIGVPAPPP